MAAACVIKYEPVHKSLNSVVSHADTAKHFWGCQKVSCILEPCVFAFVLRLEPLTESVNRNSLIGHEDVYLQAVSLDEV